MQAVVVWFGIYNSSWSHPEKKKLTIHICCWALIEYIALLADSIIALLLLLFFEYDSFQYYSVDYCFIVSNYCIVFSHVSKKG